MTHDLHDRVALITGASRGLGAAIAQKLADHGAAVAINYFNSHERAEQLAQSINDAGGKALAVGGDVRDERDIAAMVALVTQWGELAGVACSVWYRRPKCLLGSIGNGSSRHPS
jgi:NAD(P)-dependent dehydrogenase (short-subunit alcohol dehydrogenase family)